MKHRAKTEEQEPADVAKALAFGHNVSYYSRNAPRRLMGGRLGLSDSGQQPDHRFRNAAECAGSRAFSCAGGQRSVSGRGAGDGQRGRQCHHGTAAGQHPVQCGCIHRMRHRLRAKAVRLRQNRLIFLWPAQTEGTGLQRACRRSRSRSRSCLPRADCQEAINFRPAAARRFFVVRNNSYY